MLIEIWSVSDSDVDKLREGTISIDCNWLPPVTQLSGLRTHLGNEDAVTTYFKRTKEGRLVVKDSVENIENNQHRFVAFFSIHGLYRSPAVATLVGQELCDRGYHVLLTHLKLSVAAVELVPKRRSWGFQ